MTLGDGPVPMPIRGRVVKVGHDVSTDEIFPGRYMAHPDPRELADRCLEGLDPTLAARVSVGDVLVAGRNFGRGSSREQAAVVLRACGFSGVLGLSFGEIFERNAINIGLPVARIDEDEYHWFADSLPISWDPFEGTVCVSGRTVRLSPLSGLPRRLVELGGYAGYMRTGAHTNGEGPDRPA